MTKYIQNWADRHGIKHSDADKLRRLLLIRHNQGTKYSNGDPHPRATNPEDKNSCSDLWQEEISLTAKKIQEICNNYGLTFDGGTGLWGSFKRGDHYIDDLF